MVETASRAGYIYRTGQMITHFNNARLAYNLDSCTELGLPPDCNLDEEENYVFVVDYGTTFLSLGFAAVGKRLYTQIAERDWTDVEVEEVCCMDGIGELLLNKSDKPTTDEQYR